MKIKRSFLLAASIISSVIIIAEFIALIQTLSILLALGFLGLFLSLVGWIMIIEVALTIYTLLLNFKLLALFKSDHAKFKNKLGSIILAIVLNFLLAIMFFAGNTLAIMKSAGLIVAGVFYIIDFCTENGKVAKLKQAPQNEPETMVEPQPEEQNENMMPQTNIDDLEMKILKLNQMREEGLISEEDYTILIRSYMDLDQ